MTSIFLQTRGGARNSPGWVHVSPPYPTFDADTKPYFTHFRKFSGWTQLPFGWAEPTLGAATTADYHFKPNDNSKY
jgi:hypothetical protein